MEKERNRLAPFGAGIGTLWLRYRDRDGAVTERKVLVRSADMLIHEFTGYCSLRQAERTFSFERVLRAECLATGKAVGDLQQWLVTRRLATVEGAAERFAQAFDAPLGVLFAVAKADGAFRAPEKELMLQFMASNGLTDARAQKLVMRDIEAWDTPSAVRLGRDLRELAQAAEDLRHEVYRLAVAMVNSDKTVKDAERAMLARIGKLLQIKAPEAGGAKEPVPLVAARPAADTAG